MSKRIIGVFLAILVILSVFTGCGTKSAGSTAATMAMSKGEVAVAPQNNLDVTFGEEQKADVAGLSDSGNVTVETTAASMEPADSVLGGGYTETDVSNAILNERKMIRSANITVEVENFDAAYGKLNTFILGVGFIQETNINTEKVFFDNKQKLIKRGTIVLRVDKNKFDTVLNNIKGIGDVYNWNINGQDVTDKFVDIESRLKLLKLEEAKLLDYLSKLTDLDKIFKFESQLTNIRQQIESLSGNLKKMGDLVELSTITINMNEKSPTQVDPVKPKTYGQRLLDNLKGSLKGIVNFCGELLIIFVAALPALLLLGLIAVIILFVYKRVPKKKKQALTIENPPIKKDDETL